MTGPTLFKRLHDLLIALHPRWFKNRFGADSKELFSEWVRGAASEEEQTRRLRSGTLDAFKSLLRSWGYVTVKTMAKVAGGREKIMDSFKQAVRTTLRFLRRRPLQGIVVVGTLTLALGVNATLFAVARALFFRDLPYQNAERVVHVVGSATSIDDDWSFQIDPEFTLAPGIEEAALYIPGGWGNLTEAGEASRVSLVQVSRDFFQVLGVDLAFGSGLAGADRDRDVAVISHGLWRRAFGSDPEILDRSILLNGRSFRIVGVAPPEVSYPGETEAWLSLPPLFEFYGSAIMAEVVARLRPGADPLAVQVALNEGYEPKKAREMEETGYERSPLRLVPIRDHLVRDVSRPLLILMAAAGLILVLGCLNLAGVWVSRILERRDELGMRRALGASRPALFWQLLSETVFLSLLGGALALAVSWIGAGLLRSYLPGELPGVSAIGLDPLTLAFTLAITLLSGMGFGILAASRGARTESLCRTQEVSPSRESRRIQAALAVAQGAMALVLMVGATLSVRSFLELQSHELGFDPDVSLVMRVRMPPAAEGSGRDVRDYAATLRTRLSQIPGVSAVGITSTLPFATGSSSALRVRPIDGSEEETVVALAAVASPGYFEAAGISVVDGLPFDEPTEARTNDVIIDRRLANQLFHGERASGSMVEVLGQDGSWAPVRVRGVSNDVKLWGARREGLPLLYRAFGSAASPNMGIAVRTSGPPSDWLDEVRHAAREVDPTIAPFGVRTMRAAAMETIGTDQALAVVTSGFSLVAFLLAGLGLYGLVARQVTLRQQELGLRLALGANPGELVRSMARNGLVIGGLALLLGLPSALIASRILEGNLFQVEPTDPASLVAGCLGFLALSLTAAWLPARKAARVDPRDSLLGE